MSDPHAVVPVPSDELARLREELLQCRSKLALAAESAAGDGELIAGLVEALKQAIAAMWDSHYGHGIAVLYAQSVDAQARAILKKVKP